MGTLVFAHFTSARLRFAPHDIGSDKQQSNLESNRDGYLKKNQDCFEVFWRIINRG